MSDDDINSGSRTDRRSLLKTVAAGAVGTTVFFGAASAAESSEDDPVQPADCEEMVTQTQCVDSGCDCSECGCECDTIEEERTCCRDRYGNIVNCGTWQATGECCASC